MKDLLPSRSLKAFSNTIEEACCFCERNSNWNSSKIPQQFKYSKAMTKCWLEKLKNTKDEIRGTGKWNSGHRYNFLWYSIHRTLLLSRSKWLKDKPFLLKVFLIWKKWFAKIFYFSMSGNGNGPIYPLLSTWISTWTEPEALYE